MSLKFSLIVLLASASLVVTLQLPAPAEAQNEPDRASPRPYINATSVAPWRVSTTETTTQTIKTKGSPLPESDTLFTIQTVPNPPQETGPPPKPGLPGPPSPPDHPGPKDEPKHEDDKPKPDPKDHEPTPPQDPHDHHKRGLERIKNMAPDQTSVTTVVSTAAPNATVTCTIISAIASGTQIPQSYSRTRINGTLPSGSALPNVWGKTRHTLNITKGLTLCPHVNYDIAISVNYLNHTSVFGSGKGGYANITGNATAWFNGRPVNGTLHRLTNIMPNVTDIFNFTMILGKVREGGEIISAVFDEGWSHLGGPSIGNFSANITKIEVKPKGFVRKGSLAREAERSGEREGQLRGRYGQTAEGIDRAMVTERRFVDGPGEGVMELVDRADNGRIESPFVKEE